MSPVVCPSCGEGFGSLKWCHCPGCHETFASERYFDRHRVGGACQDPNTLTNRDGGPALHRSGWKATDTGKAVWGGPPHPDASQRRG